MTKEEEITEIKRILREHCEGNTSTCELEADHSPCISSTGTNKQNVSVLVERFNTEDAEVITYLNETEIADDTVSYEDLDEDVIHDIYQLLEDYEADCNKTFERCQD